MLNSGIVAPTAAKAATRETTAETKASRILPGLARTVTARPGETGGAASSA
jgi:hypothetical protein